MTRERVMGIAFAVGSLCFLIAPLGLYGRLVGSYADSLTYFIGSIPFTIGGGLQALLSFGGRKQSRAGRELWFSAAIQSVGTLFFNLTTVRALSLTPVSAHYDKLVWRPDAYGSFCFLISGLFLYLASPRCGIRVARDTPGWWEPEINLLGCVLFGVSAIAGFAEPRTGSLISARATDWTTSLGALCFLAPALATAISGLTFKSVRLHGFGQRLEHGLLAPVAEHVGSHSAVEIEQLGPSILHWHGAHPQWTEESLWPQHVSSYAILDEDRLILVDPLHPPARVESLIAAHETLIVLTCPWHERSSRELVRRHDIAVWTPAADRGSPDIRWLRWYPHGPGRRYGPDGQLPAGLTVLAGQRPNDLIIHHTGVDALIFGDTLVDHGHGLELNTRRLAPGSSADDLAARIGALLQKSPAHLLATHGGPQSSEAVGRALDRVKPDRR